MREKARQFGLLIALAGTLVGCGEKSPSGAGSVDAGVDEFGLPKLEIWRGPRENTVGNDLPKEYLPGVMYTNVYDISPAFQNSGSMPVRGTAQKVLESYGIVFGPGASVSIGDGSQLIVRQMGEQMKLVEAVLDSINESVSRIINHRVEIYEMPGPQALAIQRSAEDQADHTGEWEAVLRLMGEGGVRLVTCATVLVYSGQRGKSINAQERHAFGGEGETVAEARLVGTILEVDPVLDGDDSKVDIHLKLEHHTAPSTGGESPEFHAKIIETSVVLIDGQVKLIGAWRPSGLPEHEKRGLMHLVFLKVDIQPVHRIERQP